MTVKTNIFVGLSSVILLLLTGTLISGSARAEQYPYSIRGLMESFPTCEKAPPIGPVNYCLNSQVRENEQLEFIPVEKSILRPIMDQNVYTFITKENSPDQWIELEFIGARKWVNFLEIQFSGSDNFIFEIINTRGEREEINALASFLREGPNATVIKTIEFEPLRAKAIRWSGTKSDEVDESVDIYELQVWFHQTDSDRAADPDPSDSVNWLLCETGDPTIGPPDIIPLWNRITSRPGWCPSFNHWCHLWVPSADWAGDFKRAGVGGGENIHAGGFTGMDFHDLSVIACHGAPCKIWFTTGPAPATNVLTAPGDVFHSWGNRDAEWFCALSCSPYAFPCAWSWAQAFDGLHLQCGFITPAWATGGRFLGGFARLITRGWMPMPISRAWFVARARWQGPGTCVIVLADDKRAFMDHLWGYGYVSPDPSIATGTLRGLVYAIWDPPFDSKDPRAEEYPPALNAEQLKSISDIMSGPSSKSIPAQSSMGIPVKTTEQLYASESRDNMFVYDLIPMIINASVISDLVDDFCANYGILCSTETGQDDEGNWWAAEDEYAVWGDPESGVIQFIDDNEYVAYKEVAPTLLDPGTASMVADWLLSDLSLSPTGQYTTGATYNIQTVYDLDAEQIVADSSFDISINAEYHRVVDGYSVFGPGGYITVTIGEGSWYQHFTKGGWQDLINPVSEPIITVQEAMDLLASEGENATIGGIPPITDVLLIESSELAYYNTNGEYETDILEPIYHFACYAVSTEDSVYTDVYVPARSSLLRGTIIQPSQGSSFETGEMVTFEGSASGGTGPYTFDWESDADGNLGSGSTIMIDDLSIVYKETAVVAHSITLTITDNNSQSIDRRISVQINPTGTCCDTPGDANNDVACNVGDAVFLIAYVFQGGPAPPCSPEGDANGDCNLNVGDAVSLINYIFKGGDPPICNDECTWPD